MAIISLACSCGKVRGHLEEVDPGKSERFVCLCDDCQSYAHFLGQGKKILDPQGGTDIIAVAPAQLKLIDGLDQLQCVRLSEKGLMRWYAGCCRTPIANTPSSPSMPYAGMFTGFVKDRNHLDQTLGPIRGRVMAKFGHPPLAPDSHPSMPLSIMFRISGFLLRNWLGRKHRPSAFFKDGSREPRVVPHVLTRPEREKFRAQALAGA